MRRGARTTNISYGLCLATEVLTKRSKMTGTTSRRLQKVQLLIFVIFEEKKLVRKSSRIFALKCALLQKVLYLKFVCNLVSIAGNTFDVIFEKISQFRKFIFCESPKHNWIAVILVSLLLHFVLETSRRMNRANFLSKTFQFRQTFVKLE